jgi:hypothetical protein
MPGGRTHAHCEPDKGHPELGQVAGEETLYGSQEALRFRMVPEGEEVEFALDSSLEGDGFKLPVPRTTPGFWPISAHNASRQIPQKGSSDQTVARLRRLAAGVVGSAAACALRFRPPGTRGRAAREPAGADRFMATAPDQ